MSIRKLIHKYNKLTIKHFTLITIAEILVIWSIAILIVLYIF